MMRHRPGKLTFLLELKSLHIIEQEKSDKIIPANLTYEERSKSFEPGYFPLYFWVKKCHAL